MESIKVIDSVRISKRGSKAWNCVFYSDAPELFDVIEKAIGTDNINKITSHGYIPL